MNFGKLPYTHEEIYPTSIQYSYHENRIYCLGMSDTEILFSLLLKQLHIPVKYIWHEISISTQYYSSLKTLFDEDFASSIHKATVFNLEQYVQDIRHCEYLSTSCISDMKSKYAN